jgi:quercetin dioxygenase-like cupin family protein
MKASGILFMERSGEYTLDWHNAPRRQYGIQLEGEHEIEVGDGTKRLFRPGDILLAEDTTGRGHISRVLSSKLQKIVVVTLD